MAIIRSNNEAADAVPEIWLQTALGKLRDNIALAGIVRRDADDEVAEQGDTINVIKRGGLSVQSPAENVALTPEAPTNTKVALELTQYDAVSWKAGDIASAQAVNDALAYVEDAAAVLAENLEANLASLYTELTTNSFVGTSGTRLSLDTITSARLSLNQANVPRQDRVLFISNIDEDALLKSDQLTDVDRAGSNMALREAMLGRLRGFDVYANNQVATSGPLVYFTIVDATNGSYEIVLSGTTFSFTASSNTAAEIATGLAADIDADGAYTATATGNEILVVSTAGTEFTVDSTTSPSSGITEDSAGVHTQYHNIAMHPNAIMLAMRPMELPPPGSGALASYIVDQESGLTMRLVRQYDATARGMVYILDMLYGFKVVDPRLGVEVRT